MRADACEKRNVCARALRITIIKNLLGCEQGGLHVCARAIRALLKEDLK